MDSAHLSAQNHQKAQPQKEFLINVKNTDLPIPSLQTDLTAFCLGATKSVICTKHFTSLLPSCFLVALLTLTFCLHCINLPLLLMSCSLFLPGFTLYGKNRGAAPLKRNKCYCNEGKKAPWLLGCNPCRGAALPTLPSLFLESPQATHTAWAAKPGKLCQESPST